MIDYVPCGVITRQEGQLVRCTRDITHRGHHWRDVEPLPEGCPHTIQDGVCHCSTRRVAS